MASDGDGPRTLRENLLHHGSKDEVEIDAIERPCTDCGERFTPGDLFWFDRQTWRCASCHPEVSA